MGGVAFFAAEDNKHGKELWRTDGTDSGTWMVEDIASGAGSSSPRALLVVGSTLFFTADDGAHGRELWKSDGTAGGTVLVKDINFGSAAASTLNLVGVSGTLFFNADDCSQGLELWKSDGSSSGTVLVEHIMSGNDTSRVPAPRHIQSRSDHGFLEELPVFGQLYRLDSSTNVTAGV